MNPQHPSLIPLAVPNLFGREAELLQECITSTFVSSVGPFVDQFEADIAEVTGTNSASVLCSGTVALQMALVGLGIGAGDLVLTPSLTFIATANAVSHSGAHPLLVDCRADSWTLDLDICRELIERETVGDADGARRHRKTGARIAALMPVMIMGASLDFDAIMTLARDYQLKVVVDAAAAIGGMAGNTKLGQTGVDAVCYSFNGNKTITCGGGGAIASADDALIARIRHLVSTARVGRNYDHDAIGYNFRMTNVQAALGVAQMERLPQFLKRKGEIRDAYASVASKYSVLKPFPDLGQGKSVHWFSGFWYSGDNTELPDAFRDHMRSAGVDLRPFWKPMHLQAPYSDALKSDMSVCSDLWWRIFALPCSTHLSESELTQVTEAADDFWSRHG